MRVTSGVLLFLFASLALAEQYGAPITLKNPVSLEGAVGRLGSETAVYVLIESRVDKVCELAGCWIGLKSASGEIHVTFKDEAFVVPMTLMGKTVLAQGMLTRVAMTLDETRQRMIDNGGDPATVKQPGVRYVLLASGIQVKT